MRLSNEKARRLTALMWRERARRWLPFVAGALVIFAVLTFLFVRQVDRADRTIDIAVRDATMIDVKRGGTGRTASIVHVRLDDGRSVEAFSTMRVMPPAGTHLVVSEAKHASGRVTYDVMRLAE
jgi:hypothetical protein